MSDFENPDILDDDSLPSMFDDYPRFEPIDHRSNQTIKAIYRGDDITSIHPLPDNTVSPKTPGEALARAAEYKNIYDQLEDAHSGVYEYTQDEADYVRQELVSDRRQAMKLVAKREFLLGIKEEKDIEARQYLLSDYLDQINHNVGEVDQFNHYLLRRLLHQPTVDVFGDSNDTNKSVYFQQFLLIPMIKAGLEAEDADSFDPRQAYENAIESNIDPQFENAVPDARKRLLELKAAGKLPPYYIRNRSDFPEFTQVASQTWEKTRDAIKAAREFKTHEAGDVISLNLVPWLDEWVNVNLHTTEEQIKALKESVENLTPKLLFNDEEVVRRARSLVDQAESPIIDAAKKHAEENLTLLRRGAIAEAALDGVHIKTRSSRKKIIEKSE